MRLTRKLSVSKTARYGESGLTALARPTINELSARRMVKSSGVEKGELFVGVQIRQLVLPFPLEAPLCVPLRLSPFGKRSAFS